MRGVHSLYRQRGQTKRRRWSAPVLLLILVLPAAAQTHMTLTPVEGYDGRLKAAAEWQCTSQKLDLRLEVEDLSITPPWIGVRQGDHVEVAFFQEGQKRLALAFPAPSYNERQMLPVAGLPPTQRTGDELQPANQTKKGNSIELRFRIGQSSMSIEHSSEIRLEWQPDSQGETSIAINNLETDTGISTTATHHVANLWEPVRKSIEKEQITITLKLQPDAALKPSTQPRLIIVPKKETSHPAAKISGRRTRDTFSINMTADLGALNIENQVDTVVITIYDTTVTGKTRPAARMKKTIQSTSR